MTDQTSSLAFRRLLGIAAILLLSYLAIGLPLPVVPVYVLRHLGLSNAAGGLAVGAAFASTIFTRGLAGGFSDERGARLCMQRGLAVYGAAGLLCMAAAWPALPGLVAYGVLIAGRLLLGVGESFTVVGMISWGIGFMGAARTGRVIGLLGMCMYGALGLGAPLGLGLLHAFGFATVMGLCAALPLAGLVLTFLLPAVAPHPGRRDPFWRIMGQIWRFGTVVALQGVGFAALGAFVALYFYARHWPWPGLGISCFGAGFVISRILFSHLPDQFGGARVAGFSLATEALGQAILWLAPGPWAGFAGALLTGLGCSMVFPAMAVEVVKRISPQARGTALGGFTACQDVAYAGTGPLAGVLADYYGYAPVFLLGALAALAGLALLLASVRGVRHAGDTI